MKANIYGITVDTDRPITGVISKNAISEFLGDSLDSIIDLPWENAMAEFKAEHGREPDPDETDEMSMSMDGYCGPTLIGDWKKVRKFPGIEEWDVDEEYGSYGYAAIIREDVVQVVWSKTTTQAHHCSPCYPGQASIGEDGDFLAYTLPEHCFDIDL